MPKLPGRADTRPTIKVEQAWIASFLFPWDKVVRAKPCCIVGCDHRVDQCLGDVNAPGPATVVDSKKFGAGHKDPFVGYGCSCCVAKILELDLDPYHPKVRE